MRMYIHTFQTILCLPCLSYLYLFFPHSPAPLTDDRGSIQPGEQVL